MDSLLVRMNGRVILDRATNTGTYVGHVVPEAQEGGPIALVHDNDKIIVDAGLRTIEWLVDEETRAQRKKEWEAVERPLPVKRGVLFRYARDVQVCSCFQGLIGSVKLTGTLNSLRALGHTVIDGTNSSSCIDSVTDMTRRKILKKYDDR